MCHWGVKTQVTDIGAHYINKSHWAKFQTGDKAHVLAKQKIVVLTRNTIFDWFLAYFCLADICWAVFPTAL